MSAKRVRMFLVFALLIGLVSMAPSAFADDAPPPACPADAAIDLAKTVNGEDADVAPGPEIAIGSDVVYSYTVTNAGLVPLYGVIVADDQLGTICTAKMLAPGESATCVKTVPALEGQQKNRGKAGATCVTDAGKKVSVKDTDFGHYLGIQPVTPVCLHSVGYLWDLMWNKITGDLVGTVTPGPIFNVTGAVAPPDLFDTAAASTLNLTVVNSTPDGCTVWIDSAEIAGTRTIFFGTDSFAGTYTSYCGGVPGVTISWIGTFYQGSCANEAVAPVGIGPYHAR